MFPSIELGILAAQPVVHVATLSAARDFCQPVIYTVCCLCHVKMILLAFEADETKTREACRPRHRNAEKHQHLFSNPDIPAVFIYSHPPTPSPQYPEFHGSAEKDHPLVVEIVPRPPLPMSLMATCSELFIHHYRQAGCEAPLIPLTLAGSFLPLHAVGCQIVSGYAGRF